MTLDKLSRLMLKLKIHAKIWLIAFCFAMLAYGFIHLLIHAIRFAQKLLT
jgi:hypothetical protein